MTQNDSFSRRETRGARLAVTETEPRFGERAAEPGPVVEQPFLREHSAGSSATEIAGIIRHRRRVRLLYFIILEGVVIGLMIISAMAGISSRFAEESLTPIFRVVPVSAAIVSVILPIIFFGDPKRRNRSRHNNKRRAGD
jgi:hypothetical protein